MVVGEMVCGFCDEPIGDKFASRHKLTVICESCTFKCMFTLNGYKNKKIDKLEKELKYTYKLLEDNDKEIKQLKEKK